MALPVIVLLDRDGTINVDSGYLRDPAGLELLPGVIDGLWHMQALGMRLAVISNQSGVGRGYFTLDDVTAVNDQLLVLLREHNIQLEGMFICPHAPWEGCDCRKPLPGLIVQAARQLGFDPRDSVVIGDKESDVLSGRAAGARTILIAPKEAPVDTLADTLAVDLRGAALVIDGWRRAC